MFSNVRLERIVRGFSSRRRIALLRILEKEPDLTVGDLRSRLKVHFESAAQHAARAAAAGLVRKRRKGMFVEHRLTRRGRAVLGFLRGMF